MVETDRARRRDAHRIVKIDTGALEDADQLRVRAEPDAAARQFLLVALEYHGVPARRAQQMRHDQPAKRTTDDESAALTHAPPSALHVSSSAKADDPVVTALRNHTRAMRLLDAPPARGMTTFVVAHDHHDSAQDMASWPGL